MVTLTVAALMIATVAGAVDRSRSFAIGFAVAIGSWIYFILAFVPTFDLRDDLITDRAVGWLLITIHGEDLPPQLASCFLLPRVA